jgi:hypothetical protein
VAKLGSSNERPLEEPEIAIGTPSSLGRTENLTEKQILLALLIERAGLIVLHYTIHIQ